MQRKARHPFCNISHLLLVGGDDAKNIKADFHGSAV